MAKAARQVGYKLSAGPDGRVFWMEEREDHLINLSEEQPCIYDMSLKIFYLLLNRQLQR